MSDRDGCEFMDAYQGGVSPPVQRARLAREAALRVCLEGVSFPSFDWHTLSRREWLNLLRWLDISGLALYFLDRVTALDRTACLPGEILSRLQTNLADNTERTRRMIAESVAIQRQFQAAGIRYANLKGLSLWRSSTPRPELRSQFDLDYLVAEDCAGEARTVLEQRGYRLYLMSGRSWEFKRNETPQVSLKDLYKAVSARQVELHIEPRGGAASVLERTEVRELYGCSMPVLRAADLFLGQALHAYKHVCSEFSRTAHLVELRRHVRLRREDDDFWRELQAAAGENPRAGLGLGVITLLITQVMGAFAPEALTGWSVARLPVSARRWVERYGRQTVFGGFPGSKLYLLLQREMEAAGVPAKRALRQCLLPLRLPPPVIRALPNESFAFRLGRYRVQLSFLVFRLRFHIVEGARFAWESRRWRRDLLTGAGPRAAVPRDPRVTRTTKE